MDHMDPDIESLGALASGTLDPVLHLVLEAREMIAPQVCQCVSRSDMIGASFFESGKKVELDPGAMANIMARIDAEVPKNKNAFGLPDYLDGLPPQVLDMAATALAAGGWVKHPGGAEILTLEMAGSPLLENGGSLRIVKTPPGCRIAPHRHCGEEYNLVLAGIMVDRNIDRSRGDLVLRAKDSIHLPDLAEGPGWVVLSVVTGGIELLSGEEADEALAAVS